MKVVYSDEEKTDNEGNADLGIIDAYAVFSETEPVRELVSAAKHLLDGWRGIQGGHEDALSYLEHLFGNEEMRSELSERLSQHHDPEFQELHELVESLPNAKNLSKEALRETLKSRYPEVLKRAREAALLELAQLPRLSG